jgi:hypothetical protein
MSKDILTQSYLQSIFDYKDGFLVYKISARGISKGKVAGSPKKDSGYRVLKIKNRVYYEHRVIFAWHHGYFPSLIDHKNRNRSDNRIENLEDSNASKNALNSKVWSTNTSGYRCVTKHTKNNSWIGQTWVNGKKCHVGSFATPQEASDAVRKFREKLTV